MASQFIPPSFLDPNAVDDFLGWVALLPLDPQDKKQLMLDWAALTGTTLTADQIRTGAPGLLEDEAPPPPPSS